MDDEPLDTTTLPAWLDAMGAALMTQFHAHLRREDAAARAASTTDVAAAALRAAQIEAIRAGAHPYFWAPFQVIG